VRWSPVIAQKASYRKLRPKTGSMALGVLRMLPVLQRLGDAYGFWFFSDFAS